MKHGKPGSRTDSGAMCLTKRRRLSSSTSEHGFLADRATDAKTGMGRTLGHMKETLATMTGVRTCAAEHPWILTGSAVVAGVVAGVILVPSARKRTRRTRKTPSGSAGGAPPARREQESSRTTRSFLFSIAGTVLAAILRPMLQSWFAPAIAAQGESQGNPLSSCDSIGAVVSESGVD